ncbi:MAG: helix-turn-helix transcriptional regulator [Deltaproteobacteria bacterium]|nr:MAG: helix-turn-helix transcriptional regulator [Deltaproteobacteria bacterium]
MKSTVDQMEVGKRLQRFREVRGLTRAALALKLGITETDLENLEAGKGQLSEQSVEILRQTFGVDPAWLLGGETP